MTRYPPSRVRLSARDHFNAEALERRWFVPRLDAHWPCWCGRILACPAALDAHQFDHEAVA